MFQYHIVQYVRFLHAVGTSFCAHFSRSFVSSYSILNSKTFVFSFSTTPSSRLPLLPLHITMETSSLPSSTTPIPPPTPLVHISRCFYKANVHPINFWCRAISRMGVLEQTWICSNLPR